MPAPAQLDPDALLASLLSRWDAAGRSASALESICAEHPSLASELKSRASAIANAETVLTAASAPVAPKPPELPGYRVLGWVGQGGMGTVWRAEQLSTRREVAVKLLLAHRRASPKALARFEREVELAARLDHPRIARVYEAGRTAPPDEALFYAMQLLDGAVPLDPPTAPASPAGPASPVAPASPTLPAGPAAPASSSAAAAPADPAPHASPGSHPTAGRLVAREAVARVLPVVDALAYAHGRGVLHRDLKPSNLLVTPDGAVHVVDFGLAAEVEGAASTLTLEAPFAGTPGYCAPEQARGEPATVRSDVYSLALVLARLLVGGHVHDLSLTTAQLLHRTATAGPDLSTLAALPADLRAVLAKALAFDPADRYPGMDAFGADLRRWLDGFPVTARPPSPLDRAVKFCRRHPRAVAAWAVAGVLALSVGGWLTTRAANARAAAERDARIAAEADRFLTTILTAATPDIPRDRELTAREVLERAAGAIDGQDFPPEVEARIRHTVGIALGLVGAPSQGAPHLRAALALRRTHLGPEHPDTLETLRHLGGILTGLPTGPEFDEGVRLLGEAWTLRRKVAAAGRPGPHPRTEAARQSLMAGAVYSSLLDVQGRNAEAIRVVREVLADVGEAPTPATWEGPLEMLRLRIHWEDGNHDAAIALAAEIVRRREQHSGPTHTSTSNALFNLSLAYERAGRLEEAESTWRRCLSIRTSFTPEHPSADDTRLNLAKLLHRRGKTNEAKALLSQVTNPQARQGADSLKAEWAAAGTRPAATPTP